LVSKERVPSAHFALQVWPEATDAHQVEWRGKIHHLASGEARYFRDWPTMLAFLESALTERPPGPGRPVTGTK
jgi:hypothetical protein